MNVIYHDVRESHTRAPYIKYTETAKLGIQHPRLFKPTDFPRGIWECINQELTTTITYMFKIGNRNITVFFVVGAGHTSGVEIKYIILWLLIANKYASSKCSASLTIYVYNTSLKKTLPPAKNMVISAENANTAFTQSCRASNEIIIYRSEEWFKVLIHESMHAFGFDFSHLPKQPNTRIIKTFKGFSGEILLFETYCEFWAEVLNVAIVSFYLTPDATAWHASMTRIMEAETEHTALRVSAILDFMSIPYIGLTGGGGGGRRQYKEKTNVFAYYVLKLILFMDYRKFIAWCSQHNGTSYLQFKPTNVERFEKYIIDEERGMRGRIVKKIHEMDELRKKINIASRNSLRMSFADITEL